MENTAVESRPVKKAYINPSHIIEGLIWILFAAGILVKCTYFQFSSSVNVKPYFGPINTKMYLGTLSSILFILFFAMLAFNRKRLTALIFLDILVSLTVLADTLYFRYFYNAITVPVLQQIGLAGSVSESIKSLFRVSDLVFAADFPLFAVGLIALRRLSGKGLPRIRFWKRAISSVIIFGIGFGLFHAAYAKSSAYMFPYDNNYVVNNLGICYFHYYDIKSHLEESLFADHTLKPAEKQELEAYFSAKSSSGTKYQGMAKGKNVIIIQLEAVQQFLINMQFNGKEVMPNLDKFINECTYLDNFFYQVGAGNTSDAEFLVNNSLYPLRDGSVYFKRPGNTYESLPKYLDQQGYTSVVSHANNPSFWNRTEMYKAVGFDKFLNSTDFVMDDRLGWGLSDKSFFRQTLEKVDTTQPFYSFMITLTSHHPFTYFENDPGFDAGKYEHTMAGNYVKAANYVDYAIGELFKDLKKRGLYDDSIIVIYGDHHAVLKDQRAMLNDLLGISFDEYNWTRLHKTPCFIKFPGMTETGVNHTICGEVDILPTLANLMGFPAPHALGKDIFNTEKGYAVLRDNSVITDDYIYVSLEDKAYDHDGNVIDKTPFAAEIKKYQNDLHISDIILQKNALEALGK